MCNYSQGNYIFLQNPPVSVSVSYFLLPLMSPTQLWLGLASCLAPTSLCHTSSLLAFWLDINKSLLQIGDIGYTVSYTHIQKCSNAKSCTDANPHNHIQCEAINLLKYIHNTSSILMLLTCQHTQ